MKKADERVVAIAATALTAGIAVLFVLLFANGVAAREIDLSDCVSPPASIEYDVKKFENEGTLLAEGWAIDAENASNTFSTTVVVKDLSSGRFFRLPTATRSESRMKALEYGEGLIDFPEDKAECAGFFARGVILGGSGRYELYLVFDNGAERYLIDTNISA